MSIKFSLVNKNKQILITAEPEILSLIRENFSTSNPAYRRGSSRFTPTRLYAITPQGKLDIGLLGEVLGYINSQNYSYDLPDEVKKIYKPDLNVKSVQVFSKKTYRDYQEQSILAAIKQGRGVTVIPTAGGKTLIMAGLIKSIKSSNEHFRTLILVPSIQLVEQTANDFIEYGLENVSKWSGDNQYNGDSDIVVVGTQILMSQRTDLSVLVDFDLVLVDEVHSLKRGNRINEILKFLNTSFKFGFTGTMPSSKIDQWNIIGKIGPITYEQKTHTLKEQSYVSNFKIVILNIEHLERPPTETSSIQPAIGYQMECEFLQNSFRRNEIITNLSLRLKENTLVMVDRIEHGERLLSIMSSMSSLRDFKKPIYFIQGSTEMEDRENIRRLMDERRDVVVIAISKIFSTGINIPNLHNIIFASAGKAKIKIMQSIGRVLRLHHTKTMATIFDIADNTRYSKKHVVERKKIYTLEKYEYTEKTIT
jgi:superfamily II DNA or RNA helicase